MTAYLFDHAMYLEHFNLTRSPFEEEPDPEIFFSGGERKATFETLVEDILAGKPLIKITGREGSGKTLICRLLVNRALPDHDVVYLDNPIGSFDDLLRIVCLDLGMNPAGSHESVNFLHELYYLINQRREEGKKVLIIVDEAEKLFLATLERLVRTICETEEASTLRIVLSGRPGLDANLEQLSIYCANVGINAGHTLHPLDEMETGDYLRYRLETAGLSGDQQEELFSEAAVSKIHASARGNMRMINILAEEALQKSCTEKSFMVLLDHVDVENGDDEVSAGLVEQVRRKAELLYTFGMENRLLAGAGLGAVVLVVIIGFLVSGGEDEQPVSIVQKEVRIEREISLPPEKAAQPAIPEDLPVAVEEPVEQAVVSEEPVPEPPLQLPEPRTVAEQEPPAVMADEEPRQVVEPLETPASEPVEVVVGEVVEQPDVEKVVPVEPEPEESAIVTVGPDNKKRAVGEPKEVGRPLATKPVKREAPKNVYSGRDADQLFRDRRRASVSWLAEAYRGSYTIQLMTLTSNQAEDNLKRMMVKDEYYGIKDKLYILRKKTTPPTLFVYYGIYPSMDKARNERNTMPVFLRKHHPYPLAIAQALKKTED